MSVRQVRARSALWIVALLALGAARAPAQEVGAAASGPTLAGVVTDTRSAPIPGVEVGLLVGREIARSVRTDSTGRFELRGLPRGKTSIVARRLGFQPRVYTVQVREGSTRAFLPVVLDPMPAELDKIIVLARVTNSGGRLREFYERKLKNAWGSYFEREDIERRNPHWMSDMLRMIPGVRVYSTGHGRNAVRMRGCAPTLWVDGMPVRGAELDDLVVPSDVAGIEVYRSRAGLPPQFWDRSGCAIIVWTRVE
jgi:hypothetical protein